MVVRFVVELLKAADHNRPAVTSGFVVHGLGLEKSLTVADGGCGKGRCITPTEAALPSLAAKSDRA
jgi:hypothetical protein